MGSNPNKSYCCVCGRPLTAPESVAAGIGPVCAANILKNRNPVEGIYIADQKKRISVEELIEIAAPIIESNEVYKELRTRLLKHATFRSYRIRKGKRVPPPGYPSLDRWVLLNE